MNELLRMVPEVLRARGWRLYTNKGRLVDLWQYGGRALLGHNPPGLLRSIKNSAERGLYAPHPHFTEKQFSKALSALLPGRSFRIYESEAFLCNALRAAGITPVLWRPFLNPEAETALFSAPVLAPVLPCPYPGAPAVLALHPEKHEETAGSLPPPHLLSPVILSAAARCIYDLLAAPERGKTHFPKLDKAVKKSPAWKQQGIYLTYTGMLNEKAENNEEHYTGLFRHFLEAGFLLPPGPEEPVILPGELSPGEEAKLAGLMQE